MAMSEWHLGEIASCKANLDEAISLAKELNEANALAMMLFYAACLGTFEHNPAKVACVASNMIELSARQGFAQWLAVGTLFRGWARSVSGDTAEGICLIEEGLKNLWATGTMVTTPLLLALRAEALHVANHTTEALKAIREAETSAEKRQERWWCAELHRLRGVFLAALGAEESQIETSFAAAIRIAHEQKSVSLEKRARATYAEYARQKASGLGGSGFRLSLC